MNDISCVIKLQNPSRQSRKVYHLAATSVNSIGFILPLQILHDPKQYAPHGAKAWYTKDQLQIVDARELF